MAAPQAKLKIETPKPARKRPVYLPVRVPPEMRYDFFITIDGKVSDKEFERLVQLNDEMWFERTAQGTVEIMPSPKSITGARSSKITTQL